MSDKTLIILSPGFPMNEADTTCLPSLQVFVKNLKQENPLLKIVILSFQYPFFIEPYTWHGVTVMGFAGRNKGKFYRVRIWLLVWKKLKSLNKTNNVIGILSFWLGDCSFIGKRFGKRYNIKHYAWLLGQDAKKNNRYKYLINPTGNELIAISDSIAETFYNNYGIKIKSIIPIGIDDTLYKEVDIERNIDIMGAGSLIPLKRYDLFLEVISEVRKEMQELNVMLCGTGPEEETLYKLAETLKIQKNVRLSGELSHSSILFNMRHTKIFLHTSSYEGFSTVCAEALRAGAHVISFCKPMENDFKHWHIVNTKKEMIMKTITLLKDPNRDHSPVSTCNIHETVSRIMQLFPA